MIAPGCASKAGRVSRWGARRSQAYHRLKTMVKRSIEQNLRMKNFGARNGNFETSATAVVNNQRVKQREQRSLGDGWQWKANGQCSKGDNCSFRHDEDKRAKSTQPNPSPRSSTQQNVKNASRTKSPGGRSPSGKMARLPCKDYLKGTCTTPFCEKGHPPECLSYMSENGCKFEEKCSYAHRQVDEQPCKKCKKNGDKIAVAILKNTRQLGCVFQDMEPPKPSSILLESSNILKPIRCVRFTKAVIASRQHSIPKTIAWSILPRWSSSAWPQCSKIWGSVSRRDGMARAMCPWSSVEVGQKYPKIKWER